MRGVLLFEFFEMFLYFLCVFYCLVPFFGRSRPVCRSRGIDLDWSVMSRMHCLKFVDDCLI